MFCQKCGIENIESAEFCKSCGNKFVKTNQTDFSDLFNIVLKDKRMTYGLTGIILSAVGIYKTVITGYLRSEALLYFCILIAGGVFSYLAIKQEDSLEIKKENDLFGRLCLVSIIIIIPVLIQMVLKYIFRLFL